MDSIAATFICSDCLLVHVCQYKPLVANADAVNGPACEHEHLYKASCAVASPVMCGCGVTPPVTRTNFVHTNALVAQQVSQEQVQQQLSQVRAASKASDSSKAQAEVQHQAQLAELHHQLDTARQCNADLQQQHQQDLQQQLALAAAATADRHKHESETWRSEYTACCHQQATAMEMLQQEVALLTQEAERDMTSVAQKMSALHCANHSSQTEVQQQLQQLRAEIAAMQSDSTSIGSGGGMQEALHALMDIRQQLNAVGCAGIRPLLQEHQQLRAQVSCASTQVSGKATAVTVVFDV